MKKNISVVMPVYNAENTIAECIKSVLRSLQDSDELIIVDDGSADNTANICKDYAYSNNNIIYIYQSNKGTFSARLTGLKYSKGEYISFIDADDICTDDRYYVMNSMISEYDADIFFFGATVKKKKSISEVFNIDMPQGTYSNKEIFEQYAKLLFGRLQDDKKFCAGYVWNTLIRKEILRDLLLYEDERIQLFEDEVIMTIASLNAKKCVVSAKELYIYEHSNYNTASKKKGYWKGYWENIVTVYKVKKKIAIINNIYDEEIQLRLATFLAKNCLRSIYNETSYDNPKNIMQAIAYTTYIIPKELRNDIRKYEKNDLFLYERVIIWIQLHNGGFINYFIYFLMYDRMRKFKVKKRFI